jgi:hypothetical protein
MRNQRKMQGSGEVRARDQPGRKRAEQARRDASRGSRAGPRSDCALHRSGVKHSSPTLASRAHGLRCSFGRLARAFSGRLARSCARRSSRVRRAWT